MDNRPTHPKLARRGIIVGTNSPAVTGLTETRAASPRSSPRAAMLDTLPSLRTIGEGLQTAIIPTIGAVSANGIAKEIINVSIDDLGEELWLNGATVTQGPTDSVGGIATDDGPSNQWGDRYGRRACVMIGIDILKDAIGDGWFRCPCNDSSFRYVLNGWEVENPNDKGEGEGMLWRLSFPAGRLTDTNIFKRVLTKSFGALGARVGFGHRLQAALVLPASGDLGVGAPIVCDIDVQLHLARTYAPNGFSENAP